MTRTRPYPFQAEAVRKVVDQFNNRAIIGMEPGLGKTITSLLCCLAKEDSWPAVVVCPATIKLNWQKEAALHCGIRADVLETTRPPGDDELPTKSKLWIINYEILHAWVGWLRSQKVRTVIFDESQRIGNWGTRVTKSARALTKEVPYVLALSGTPLVNRPIELYPICNILRPNVSCFNNPFKFGQKFCAPKWTRWGWDYRGASNTAELHDLLTSEVMIRYRKRDVLRDLPDKTQTVVPVPMSNPDEYREAETDFVGWLEKTRPNRAHAARKAHRLVQMGYLRRLAATLKHKSTSRWVKDFLEGTDDKLILFGIHREVAMPLYEEFKRYAVLVHGGVKGKDRQRAIDQFNSDKRKRLFVGNIRAAGVGWNGQVASTVAFCELDWVPGNMLQASDRAHRIGQKNAVNVIYIVAADTIEETLCQVLQEKQKTINEILDGGDQHDSLDLFDKLEEELLRTRQRKSGGTFLGKKASIKRPT